MLYIFSIFKSNYCKIVFLISFIAGYFLLPKDIFVGGLQVILSFLFVTFFALVLTCLVRNVKEKIIIARTYTGSIISIVAVALGLAALQACGVGAPVCGATLGIGFMSAIFPSFFLNFFMKYGLYILVASILFQIVSLYFMNCFKKMEIRS